MQKQKNPYQQKIDEKQIKTNAIKEQIQKNLKEMEKHTQTAIQIGHDGRVDEAIMLAFLTSLLESTINSYRVIKGALKQRELNLIEQRIKDLIEAKNLDSTLEQDMKDLNNYQVLNNQASVLRQELQDPSLSDKEKQAKQKKLDVIVDKMETIREKLKEPDDKETPTEAEFEKRIEPAQKTYFGEKGAQNFKDFRNFSGSFPELLEQAGIDKKDIDKKMIDMIGKISIMNNTKELMDKALNEAQAQTTQTTPKMS